MCSCVDAFDKLRACAIVVVGVAGNMPIHGIGTALFLVTDSLGEETIIRIHDCLLCTNVKDEETFNLISVSQMMKIKQSAVSFSADIAAITLKHHRRKQGIVLNLDPDDGLYAISVKPISSRDIRRDSILSFDLTRNEDVKNKSHNRKLEGYVAKPMHHYASMKSPTKLGIWYTKVLWVGKIISLAGKGFKDELRDFCSHYIAPISIPPARKSYQVDNIDDIADLSIRFLGVGTERLKKTVERSIGLSPMVKVDGKMRHPRPVPYIISHKDDGK
jgi:hypothetical protein